jgi:MraZ protein
MGKETGGKMFLAGTHELTIDNKNRLSIPFAIRRKLNEERDGHAFYVMPGRRKGTLALYPEKYYEQLRGEVPGDDSLSDEAYAYRQFEYSQSALLDPDSQGRVLIPERLLKKAGLDKDVVLIAVRDHLELWRQADFEAFEGGMWPDYPQQRAKAIAEQKQLTERLSSSGPVATA